MSDRRTFLRRSASVVGVAALGPTAAAATRPDDPCKAPSRHMFEGRVVARAWRDRRYRARLMEDPRGALAEVIGQEIPRDVRIRVVEEDPNTLYFVLPHNPMEYEGAERLDEEAMNRVASGFINNTACARPSTMSSRPSWFTALDFRPRSR